MQAYCTLSKWLPPRDSSPLSKHIPRLRKWQKYSTSTMSWTWAVFPPLTGSHRAFLNHQLPFLFHPSIHPSMHSTYMLWMLCASIMLGPGNTMVNLFTAMQPHMPLRLSGKCYPCRWNNPQHSLVHGKVPNTNWLYSPGSLPGFLGPSSVSYNPWYLIPN